VKWEKEWKLLRWVFKAADSQSSRYALSGFRINGDIIAATDGRRVHYAEFPQGFVDLFESLGDIIAPIGKFPAKIPNSLLIGHPEADFQKLDGGFPMLNFEHGAQMDRLPWMNIQFMLDASGTGIYPDHDIRWFQETSSPTVAGFRVNFMDNREQIIGMGYGFIQGLVPPAARDFVGPKVK